MQNPVHAPPQNFEVRPSVRQSPPQLQYLQPNPVDYKTKTSPTAVNTRSFKLPSPPLVPVTTQQVSINDFELHIGATSRHVIEVRNESFRSHQVQVAVGVGAAGGLGAGGRNQEQYRSHSLPLGAQLGADWAVSAPAHAHPGPRDAAGHAPRVSRDCLD